MNKASTKKATNDPMKMDEEIETLAREAYAKFNAEPLVQRCGGVDKGSYCCGFETGYRMAIDMFVSAAQSKTAMRLAAELKDSWDNG